MAYWNEIRGVEMKGLREQAEALLQNRPSVPDALLVPRSWCVYECVPED